MKKILLLLIIASIAVNPSLALAEEITVSGNGDGSSNAVNISTSNTNSVEQNNTAQVTNNVEVNADTGGNSASENNGDTAIITGDISTNTQIINAGINQSQVEIGCCDNQSTAITVSGNGSNSTNSVSYGTNTSTNVSVNNVANINNSIVGKANTGYNTANQNQGNVSIKTGDIKVVDKIINRSINISQVEAKNGMVESITIKIKDNGEGSNNTIDIQNDNTIDIAINDEANINNESNWDLNTGYNEANKNNGDVEIETGDIVYNTTIENSDINTSIVDVDCCNKDNDTDKNPLDETPPSNPTPNNPAQGSTSGGSSGSTGGTTTSQPILPITGSPSFLVLALAVTLMFFLGWYLRLRSGRSPNLAI